MANAPLTYLDSRSLSTYTIYLDDDGSFAFALLYMERVGEDGILLEEWEEIPQPHRNEIEKLLNK